MINEEALFSPFCFLQHKLEGALLALGQFQHALSELQSWLSHTHATLDTQRPINSDPKAIEIELARHHVRLPLYVYASHPLTYPPLLLHAFISRWPVSQANIKPNVD